MSEAGSAPKQDAAGGYRVLARKYRPADFSALIGQQPMVRTLTNAFATNRIAQAWMLTGVRGVGKTTTARILARALNFRTAAVDRPTVDLTEVGEHCRAILDGRHVDVTEMDAASHTGIDDVREIIEQARYAPLSARYKVFIIDEVHMLSTQAFNGLLKTLEEPPAHVKFIFATTEIRKVPITILSRTQRFDLRRVEAAALVEHLRGIADKEAVAVDDAALAMVARAAEGSVRDALSIFDQAIAHGAGAVSADEVRDMLGLADRARIVDLFELLMRGDVAAALEEFRAQYDVGADPVAVLTDLAEFTHLVTRLRVLPSAAEDTTLPEEERRRGAAFAQTLSLRVLSRTWQMLLKGIAEVQSTHRPASAAEMLLIRIAHSADLPTLDEAIRSLEDAGSGSPRPAAVAPTARPQLPAAGPSSPPRAAASRSKTSRRRRQVAGLDPSLVAAAAAEIDVPEFPRGRLLAPTEVVWQRVVRGRISDDAWEKMVGAARVEFGQTGTAGQIGRTREWTVTAGGRNAQAVTRLALEPVGDDTRIVVTRSAREAVQRLTVAGTIQAAMSVILGGLFAFGVDPKLWIPAVVLGILAVVLLGGSQIGLRVWHQAQERRLEALLDRLELAARIEAPEARAATPLAEAPAPSSRIDAALPRRRGAGRWRQPRLRPARTPDRCARTPRRKSPTSSRAPQRSRPPPLASPPAKA